MNLDRTLLILEVSKKQDYIFASRKLRENVARSAEIRAVTESAFFRETAGGLYSEAENLVYTGGGHTVLQFPDDNAAERFTRAVTAAALRRFPEMELYAKKLRYDATRTPEQNLKDLTAALEVKKSLRRPSFRALSLGVERMDRERWQPAVKAPERESLPELAAPPEGWEFPRKFEDLAGSDNFLAVVHADGNAMGKRVEGLLKGVADWDAACARLRRFSGGVDGGFRAAFSETVETLLKCRPELAMKTYLPIRPVILAGDDVCFVTAGSLGLECARVFLEKLAAKANAEDGKPYAACAGVALVHQKYPFHMAYGLSEELCSSAKKFGAALDSEGRISAMDWHVEFGQLKNGLGEIREDYETEDGNRLELRPVAVVTPEEAGKKPGAARTYAYFREMCAALRGEYGSIARGKLKGLRTALKQGEIETRFFLADRQIAGLLRSGTDKAAFAALDGEEQRRSLFFDALEMIDHFEPLEEVSGA